MSSQASMSNSITLRLRRSPSDPVYRALNRLVDAASLSMDKEMAEDSELIRAWVLAGELPNQIPRKEKPSEFLQREKEPKR